MEIYTQNDMPRPIARAEAHGAALAGKYGWTEPPWYPPTDRFYLGNYILDGCVTSDLFTAYGYYRNAAKQLNSFRRTQRPSGMVPGVSHPPKGFSINPERWLSIHPFEANDYTQSPVWAYSVEQLYKTAIERPPATKQQAIDPDLFLKDIYPNLFRHYGYLIKHRQVASDDPRTFLAHPHEANRDSGTEYDEWKRQELERQLGKAAAALLRRKPRTGEHMPAGFNNFNRVVDYLGSLAINIAGFKNGWDPARIRESSGEFVDVWFNCLLYENYRSMSELATRLGRSEDADMFGQLSLDLEQAIINKHHFSEARNSQGAFYSTYNGNPTYRDTIGNFPVLLLRNLPAHQLRSIIVLARTAFNTPFPMPSVATDDIANYDPHYEEEDRHWRGPAWPVANRIAMRGYDIQSGRDEMPQDLRDESRELHDDIHASNLGMVAVTGDYAEHHNPNTGLGQRMHKTRGHIFGATAHHPL